MKLYSTKRNCLVHQSIKTVFISAFTLDTATDFLSILELDEGGDGLELDERVSTVRMVGIALINKDKRELDSELPCILLS